MWEYTVAWACMRILFKTPNCHIYPGFGHIECILLVKVSVVGSRYVIGIVFLEESVSTYEKSKNIWCINKAILAYLNCGDLYLTAS
jgi:hypothetical protein